MEMSTVLIIIRKMKVKIVKRYYLIPFRVNIIKIQNIASVDEDMKKMDSLNFLYGRIHWCNFLKFVLFSKQAEREIICPLVHSPKGQNEQSRSFIWWVSYRYMGHFPLLLLSYQQRL